MNLHYVFLSKTLIKRDIMSFFKASEASFKNRRLFSFFASDIPTRTYKYKSASDISLSD